jgi:hypothetical protein
MAMRPEDQIYFAHRLRGAYFHACPREWWTRLNGLEDCPVVRIRLRERREDDPLPVERSEPDHHGWLPTGGEEYRLIWPSRVQVDMCFPYGAKAEEERGAGRLVRFVATEIAEENGREAS